MPRDGPSGVGAAPSDRGRGAQAAQPGHRHHRHPALPRRVDQRTNHSLEVVEKLRSRFPDITYTTVIRENIRLAECPSMGEPITTFAPSSSGAEDYRKLADEIISQESNLEELPYGKAV